MKKRQKTRPPLPLLTAAAFKHAAAGTAISADNREYARRVLVDGERVIAVAEGAGISRQRVYQVIEKLLAKL